MKKIGLFVKAEKAVRERADVFELWLRNKSNKVIRIQNDYFPKKLIIEPPKDLYCIFVLGGDGTFLSAVRWMKENQIPIIGVKFGEVGFLSETTAGSIYDVADIIISGHFNIQSRMRLLVEVIRKGKRFFRESVFNDVVINKGALARLATIRTYINNNFLTNYRGDGLIISTPTGSTAYSLAAGGPIIHPLLKGILITPICPFALTDRPLILSDKETIAIKLIGESSDIMLTFDGQIGIQIDQRDVIIIKKSHFPVAMISLSDQNYFKVLKTKLRWGATRI